MKYISNLLAYCLFFLLSLTNCQTEYDCSFKPGGRFDGNGILLVQGNAAQDGWSFVTFFPACQVDTTDLLGTLKRAHEGIIMQADHQEVLAALRKRTIILTRNDSQKPLILRKIYLTSVHILFTDTANVNSESVVQSIQSKLSTDKVECEQKIITINGGTLHANKIVGI